MVLAVEGRQRQVRPRHLAVLGEDVEQQGLATVHVALPAAQIGLDDGQRQVAGVRTPRPRQQAAPHPGADWNRRRPVPTAPWNPGLEGISETASS